MADDKIKNDFSADIFAYEEALGTYCNQLALTLGMINNLLVKIDGMKWKGEHRDQARALLDITRQYHENLLAAVQDIHSSIYRFRDYFAHYTELIEYRRMRDIEL